MKNICVLFILLHASITNAQLVINEAMSSNKTTISDEANQFDDWIEIYNSSGNSIDLQSYYLSDNPSNPLKWEIDASIVIPAGGFALFWADEDQSQGPTHTNFKLSGSGETIYLSNPSGTLIDQLQLPAMQDDFSYGRVSDGSTELSNFSLSSPNQSNANGEARVSAVIFSISGGIYSNNVSVSLSTITNGTTIRYTTNGGDPSSSSTIYSSPINVSDVNTIRAKAFRSGWEESYTTSETYLVGVNHSLPIVSISTHPDNLWDDQIGIYVEGTNGITGNCSSTPKNWNQPWERPANIQFYDENGVLGFNIDAGISVSGGCSRRNPLKGLNIETKSEYPSENIPYQLFPNRDQHVYRRFKLRTGSWSSTLLHDSSVHAIVEDELDIDLQSTRNTVVYLNDEYWGIMKIRDVHSQHSIKFKHPKVDKDSINLMDPNLYTTVFLGDFPVNHGQAQDFFDFYNYVENNDISNSTHYNYVKEKVDINEYINYHIIQLFVANTDWPAKNFKVWHEQNGPARWMLLDTDFGLGLQQNSSNPRTKNPPDKDMLDFATTAAHTGWPNDHASTLFLRKFLDNTEFKNEFIQRYATQLAILFTPTRTNSVVDEIANELDPEINGHINRWGVIGSKTSWMSRVDDVKDWLNQRPAHVYTNIQNFFGIGGTYNLTIPVSASTNGRVLLNENEYLAPLNYTGKYFDGIPITLTAVADPGYRFSHWQQTGSTDARITPSYSTNKTLTPVFVPATDLVINEIHYNPRGSQENAEFIEIYNPDSNPRDLSGLEFTDGICFDFPPNSSINGNEYIIIANDASIYQGNGYQVFEWEESNLNNNGERLELSNQADMIIDSLRYNDGADWPSTADNGFFSLGLLDHTFDNALGTSWDVQSVYTTPGAANQFLPFDTYHLPSDLVINEIHYHPFDSITPSGDTIVSKNYEFIELKNIGNTAFDLDDVALSRGVVYEFPDGSTIPPNGHVVIAEDSLLFFERYNFYPMGVYSGKLSNSGELIWLSDVEGKLLDAVRYDDMFPWDTEADGGFNDYSLALIDATRPNDTHINWKRQCTELQTPLQDNDFGCFNGQNVQGLTINEIHYDPTGGNSLEYIELVNFSNAIIQLEGLTFTNGITYTFDDLLLFPAATSPANYMVIAQNANAFQNQYNIAAQGDYVGSLANEGETIRLEDFFGNLVDEVSYDNASPWSIEPGQGTYSLALIDHNLDNNLASSWCIQDNIVSPKQPNSFSDSDGDGIVDCIDSCPSLNNSMIGTACNDGDPCTTGETYNTNCACAGGTIQDSDGDGVCDAQDQCFGIDDALIGTACSDGDLCTVGEVLNSNCQCTGGTTGDSDNDGVCDALDQCPNFNDSLIGQACNDGDACTSGETYSTNCLCEGGSLNDADGDGVCDIDDQCPGTDDSIIGSMCDDGDACTISDQYNISCNCVGVQSPDTDNDGVCDAVDQCPNFDDSLIGQPCDDGILCFSGSTWDSNCNCSGGQFFDSDNDNVCDPLDQCPGFDDDIDVNNNGIPDGCEGCEDLISELSQIVITNNKAANIRIETNGTVNNAANIIYKAGQEIELMDHFEVKLGAVFHAFIAPCN